MIQYLTCARSQTLKHRKQLHRQFTNDTSTSQITNKHKGDLMTKFHPINLFFLIKRLYEMHKSHLLLTKYASGHSYLVKKWQICTPLGPTQKKKWKLHIPKTSCKAFNGISQMDTIDPIPNSDSGIHCISKIIDKSETVPTIIWNYHSNRNSFY